MNKVTVYILHKDLVKDSFDKLLEYVDKKRSQKALKYTNQDDKNLSLGASFLIKKYLGDKQIKEGIYGKPYIEDGAQFNISHSGNYSVLAICPSNDVGADIQLIDEKRINAVKSTLNNTEEKETDTNNVFRMWSNKESLIKCIGSSLNDIKKVPGLPLEGERTFNGASYFSKSDIFDNHSLSITIRGNENFEISLIYIKSIEL